jgi:hypothetical protein
MFDSEKSLSAAVERRKKEVKLDFRILEKTARKLLGLPESSSVHPDEIVKVLAKDIIRNLQVVQISFPEYEEGRARTAMSQHFMKTLVLGSLIIDNLDKVTRCSTTEELLSCLLDLVEQHFQEPTWKTDGPLVKTLLAYEEIKAEVLNSGHVDGHPISGEVGELQSAGKIIH